MHYSKALSAMVMAGAVALTGCGGSDDDPVFITVNSSGGAGGSGATGSTGSNANGGSNCDGIAIPNGTTTIDGETVTLCTLPGRINEDMTLSPTDSAGNPVAWNLDDAYTLVGNGEKTLSAATEAGANVADVTLTIEAGTQFRSSGKGSLIITRGAQIEANGTSTDPIVMASLDDDFDGRSEWGGLVIQGFATHNKCDSSTNSYSPPASCNILGEGGVGSFGGTDDADSSGTITYLVVAEGGYEVSPDNEINGISLMSVGNGTTIENIQVHNNSDDGIEFFGGTVNVKNMVLTENADDSVDWDEGWQGAIQFALVKTAADARDHGIEADNAGDGNDDAPRSQPILANVTWYGATGFAGNAGHRLRRGTGGHLIHSILSNYDECLDVDSAESNAIIDTQLTYRNFIIDCPVETVADNERGGGDDYANNVIESTTYDVFSTVVGSSASGGVITGTVDPATYAWDTPGEATGFAMNLTGTPSSSSFIDSTVTYIGAVDPNDPATNFWDGWIIPGSL